MPWPPEVCTGAAVCDSRPALTKRPVGSAGQLGVVVADLTITFLQARISKSNPTSVQCKQFDDTNPRPPLSHTNTSTCVCVCFTLFSISFLGSLVPFTTLAPFGHPHSCSSYRWTWSFRSNKTGSHSTIELAQRSNALGGQHICPPLLAFQASPIPLLHLSCLFATQPVCRGLKILSRSQPENAPCVLSRGYTTSPQIGHGSGPGEHL